MDPSLFTSVTDNTLLPFGDTLIAQGDDNEEGPFDITAVFEAGFLFGSQTFNELFVGTNGGVTFNAANLPSGTYLYRLTSPSGSETKTMLLLK